MEVHLRGKIKLFNSDKGYGFIDNGAGPDIYFNRRSVLDGSHKLRQGVDVNFDVFPVEGEKLVARAVSVVSQSNASPYTHGDMPRFVMQ